MGKIFLSYKIETMVEGTVRPGDEIKGKVFVRNEEKKEQKLKYLGASIQEHCLKTEYDPDFGKTEFDDGKSLKKVDIYSGGKIGPGETMEFDFVIKLPSFPSPRLRDWYVSIDFLQKTGIMKNQGKEAEDAKCILPVPGSKRVPSIGNLRSPR